MDARITEFPVGSNLAIPASCCSIANILRLARAAFHASASPTVTITITIPFGITVIETALSYINVPNPNRGNLLEKRARAVANGKDGR